MSPIVPPDQEARLRAATDFKTNLVVEAGAGAGKTSLLVERLLNAVGSGTTDLGRVAAITFTEKAAGELKHRLATRLEQLRRRAAGEAASSTPSEADRAYAYLAESGHQDSDLASRALTALESLDEATVTTIHGFCATLLRRFPREAGVDPDFSVDSGQEWKSAFDAFWDRWTSTRMGTGGAQEAAWRESLKWARWNEVRQLTLALASFEHRLPAPHADDSPLTSDFGTLFGSVIDDYLARGPLLLNELVKRGAYGQRLAHLLSALELLKSDGVAALRQRLATDENLVDAFEMGAVSYPAKGNPTQLLPQLVTLHKELRKLLKLATVVHDPEVAALQALASEAAREFREAYLHRGAVSFDGLLALTRDLLVNSKVARESVRRSFDAILIDEFQDTDPTQYEIAWLLAAPVEAEGPLAELPLQRGKLFVVGDPKQSIYRFRGADFTAYDRAVNRISQTGAKLELTANFRSTKSVLDPINTLLEQHPGSWSPSSYQPPYRPVEAVRPARDHAAIEIWRVGSGASTDTRRLNEGRAIADQILTGIEEGSISRFGDVTLLLRGLTKVAQYVRPLREAGIPFVIDGGKEFLLRPEVNELLSLLRVLSQPSDEPALLAILRSPVGGVSDAELYAYAEAGGKWDWRAEVEAERYPHICATFKLLRQIDRQNRDQAADVRIEHALRASQLVPLSAAAYEGAQRVANLEKLAAAAKDLAREGRLSLEQIVEALRDGELDDLKTDRPLADDAADAVRISTVHRMKGLENRLIIFADLCRRDQVPPTMEKVYAHVEATEHGNGSAIQIDKRTNTLEAWRKWIQPFHEEAEELRVFYVALTRARDRLILVDGSRPSRLEHGQPADAIGGKKQPESRFLRALAPWGAVHEVEHGEFLADGAVLVKDVLSPRHSPGSSKDLAGVQQASIDRHIRLEESWRQQSAPELLSPSRVAALAKHEASGDADKTPAGIPPGASTPSLGALTGDVVHALLEENAGNSDALVEAIPATLARFQRPAGVDEMELKREVAQVIEKFLASPLAAHFDKIDVVGRELPMILAASEEHPAIRGTIDLVYRTAEGGWVVADYKTDRVKDGATLVERYAPQLRLYREAIARAFDVEARAELWALRLGQRIELD